MGKISLQELFEGRRRRPNQEVLMNAEGVRLRKFQELLMYTEGVRVEKIEELPTDAEGVRAKKMQELLMNVEGVAWKTFDLYSSINMKNMRNYMNLRVLIAFLEHVAKYQKWGQREKESAFERKRARKQLEINLKQLSDEKRIEKSVKQAFEKIDLKDKMMKNSGIKVKFCPGKLSEVVKKVRDTQMKMAKVFLKEKDDRHLNENHAVLDPLSDVFDIRNWSLVAFDPSYEKNKKDKVFNEYMLEMRKKIEAGKEFFCDLDEDVEEELIESMKMIYEYRKEESDIEFDEKGRSYYRSMEVFEE